KGLIRGPEEIVCGASDAVGRGVQERGLAAAAEEGRDIAATPGSADAFIVNVAPAETALCARETTHQLQPGATTGRGVKQGEAAMLGRQTADVAVGVQVTPQDVGVVRVQTPARG